MSDSQGLVFATLLAPNTPGRGKPMTWQQVGAWTPSDGALWAHFDYADDHVQEWLSQASGIDPITSAALLATDPRPRIVINGDGIMMILRGVNLNEGAQPEDMVGRTCLGGRPPGN